MKSKYAFATLLCALALPACTTMGKTLPDKTIGQVALVDADGRLVGSALISDREGVASFSAQVNGLTAGLHGIHLHTSGKCEAPSFTTAGGHLNPGAHQHGALNPAGPHMGDLPNIDVQADGTGSVAVALGVSVAEIKAALFDADGTAVVVHAGPDDYKTDPSGNSGGRIACGVVTAPGR